jgi:hypothetical protein
MKNKNYQKGSTVIIAIAILLITFGFGLFFYFYKNKKVVEENISAATPTMSYTGVYENGIFEGKATYSVEIIQDGNIISFKGEGVYLVYDIGENGEVKGVRSFNDGDIEGTATIVGNKARWIDTAEWQSEVENACIIDFTFNTDDTLNIDTSNFLSCGWGNNVNFRGVYTKVTKTKSMEQNAADFKQFKGSSYPVSQKLTFKSLAVVLGMKKEIEELAYDSTEDVFYLYQPGGYSTIRLILTDDLSALASVDTKGDGALSIKKCDKKPYPQLGEHIGAEAIKCEITHINPEDTTQSDSSSITNCYIPLKNDIWLAYEQKMKFQGDVDLCDSLKEIGLKKVSVESGSIEQEYNAR